MSAGSTVTVGADGIRFARQRGFAIVEADLFLPQAVETIFPFFADAANLGVITPPWLQFEMLTPGPIAMREGALIDYRLRLHGFPLRWQSEITVWDPPRRFVDEQRRGPYRVWIHEHGFAARDGGCEVRDKVSYKVPGGWLVDRVFVRRDVRRIFEYRARKLREQFGKAMAER